MCHTGWTTEYTIWAGTRFCFVCLGFFYHSKSFNSFGEPVKGYKFWPILHTHGHCKLNSEGSLTCHIYCDTGQPFIMVISEDSWHSQLLPSDWQWSCPDRWLNPDLPHARRTLYQYATAPVQVHEVTVLLSKALQRVVNVTDLRRWPKNECLV